MSPCVRISSRWHPATVAGVGHLTCQSGATVVSIRSPVVIVLVLGLQVFADVVSSECDLPPTEEGWLVQDSFCDPQEWVAEGSFFQYMELCDGTDPPTGQQSFFFRSLTDFVSTAEFFLEFRMETTGDRSEIPFGAPAGVALGSDGPTRYNFVIAKDLVRFWRDNQLPIPFFDIEPGVPHTYRVELYGDVLYSLYIDGEIVDQGLPEGPYPSSNPRLNFGARSHFGDNLGEWEYFRWGDLPIPGSGDFDSEGDVDLRDFFYFHECASNSGPGVDAGPGCRWADMDGDTDVDLIDFALFQRAFTGSD